MQVRIGRNDVAPIQNPIEILVAVEVSDPAARFAYQQHSRCNVPGIELEFPIAIQSAGGGESKVESSGTHSPQSTSR